jgi:hypothetical protein
VNKEEAAKKIADLLEQADALIAQAVGVSEESGISFYWDGPKYGMGGYYNPEEDGWNTSAHSC